MNTLYFIVAVSHADDTEESDPVTNKNSSEWDSKWQW